MSYIHPMLQESWDEAAACAQMEYDQARLQQQTESKGLPAPIETGTTFNQEESQNGIYCF